MPKLWGFRSWGSWVWAPVDFEMRGGGECSDFIRRLRLSCKRRDTAEPSRRGFSSKPADPNAILQTSRAPLKEGNHGRTPANSGHHTSTLQPQSNKPAVTPNKDHMTLLEGSCRVLVVTSFQSLPGIYPDEWHWREGISKPDKFREIVNAWRLTCISPSGVLPRDICWVAVKESKLGYHIPKTLLFILYPHYGNLI